MYVLYSGPYDDKNVLRSWLCGNGHYWFTTTRMLLTTGPVTGTAGFYSDVKDEGTWKPSIHQGNPSISMYPKNGDKPFWLGLRLSEDGRSVKTLLSGKHAFTPEGKNGCLTGR